MMIITFICYYASLARLLIERRLNGERAERAVRLLVCICGASVCFHVNDGRDAWGRVPSHECRVIQTSAGEAQTFQPEGGVH